MTLHDLPPVDNRFFDDPHGFYRDVAAAGPVQRVALPDGTTSWLVTGYAEARELLADPRLSKDGELALKVLPTNHSVHQTPLFGRSLVNSDPPEHTRLRGLVKHAFTPRAVARLRAAIQVMADDLIEAMGDSGETDVIDAFAFPLPIGVISELLGVPQADRAQVREWTDDLVSDTPPEAIARAGQAFGGYLAGLVAAKRANPGNDLISDLLRAAEDDRVTEADIVNLTFLLLGAGHETTVSLIGNTVLQLLRYPDQLERLRADPDLLPAAIEEGLRHSSPVHTGTLRFTTGPVTVAGVKIPPHETVHISFLAANNDAGVFPDPERFDIARDTRGHIGFGHGIHFCVGAPLARMEGEIALRALLGRFSRLELTEQAADLRWKSSIVIHGLRTLPIRYAR